MVWPALRQVLIVVAMFAAIDWYEWDVLRAPVVWWRATVPVGLLVLAFWPRLSHWIEGTKWRLFREKTVLWALLWLAGFTALTGTENVLPHVPPAFAAVAWAAGWALLGAGGARLSFGEGRRIPPVLWAVAAASQAVFAAAMLYAMHRSDLGVWTAGVASICVVAGFVLPRLGKLRRNRKEQRYERVLVRQKASAPND